MSLPNYKGCLMEYLIVDMILINKKNISGRTLALEFGLHCMIRQPSADTHVI
jgi:hypothetical protein